MGFLCCSFTNANGCTASQNLATHSRVVLVMVCIVETRLTVVLDLMHILAFQTLKFCKSLRQTNSTTLYNTFMCFSKERDYLVLSRTYSCTTTDSIGVENCKVLEHYSSIYDAREVTDCVCVCVCACVRACVRACMRACVCVCCLFVLFCTSADMANKHVHC